jgi:hypothetical protein
MLDQPAWVNGLMIVGASMLVAALVTQLIRRRVRAPSGESHNEVAGFIFATVGVLDAVLLTIMIFALWEGYGAAEPAAAQEAATILATARYATTVPAPVQHELIGGLRTYTEIVLTREWKTMTEAAGAAGDRAIAALWRGGDAALGPEHTPHAAHPVQPGRVARPVLGRARGRVGHHYHLLLRPLHGERTGARLDERAAGGHHLPEPVADL